MALIMLLLINEWSMYLWPNWWNGSWYVEASMPLGDSQLSMRPPCSDLLFTPIDYIFVQYVWRNSCDG